MDIVMYLALLPVAVLLMYIYKKDLNPEPMNHVWKIFGWGCLSVIPILIVELALSKIFSTDNYDSLISLFVSVFVGIALVEEFFKWLVIKMKVYDHPDLDERYDAIVYAVAASLGFACVENVLYVIGSETSVYTALLRAVTAVPGHTCFAVVMGYYIGHAKSKGKESENKYLAISLLIPTLLHTIYDFLIMSGSETLAYIWIGFVIVMFILCIRLVKKTSKEDALLFSSRRQAMAYQNQMYYNQYQQYPNYQNGYINQGQYQNQTFQQSQGNVYQGTAFTQTTCMMCGANVTSEFCPNCGNKVR